jgi:RNA exonuclease 1
MDKLGYITSMPPSPNADPLKSQQQQSRICDRCNAAFYVDADIGTECRYHLGRKVRGAALDSFTCCASNVACASHNTHVFKLEGAVEMHREIPFSTFETPGTVHAVAIDCEMSYTSLGMEVTRVTVLDTKGAVLVDELILPSGRVLDLNTR